MTIISSLASCDLVFSAIVPNTVTAGARMFNRRTSVQRQIVLLTMEWPLTVINGHSPNSVESRLMSVGLR